MLKWIALLLFIAIFLIVAFIASTMGIVELDRDIRSIAKIFLFAFIALVVIPLSIRSQDY